MKVSGTIIDGTTKIGTFDSIAKIGDTDAYEVINVRILNSYFSVPDRKINKLHVITGIAGENSYVMHDDLGRCDIMSNNNIWIGDRHTVIEKGILSQCV